jgi:hypothetical protein
MALTCAGCGGELSCGGPNNPHDAIPVSFLPASPHREDDWLAFIWLCGRLSSRRLPLPLWKDRIPAEISITASLILEDLNYNVWYEIDEVIFSTLHSKVVVLTRRIQ